MKYHLKPLADVLAAMPSGSSATTGDQIKSLWSSGQRLQPGDEGFLWDSGDGWAIIAFTLAWSLPVRERLLSEEEADQLVAMVSRMAQELDGQPDCIPSNFIAALNGLSSVGGVTVADPEHDDEVDEDGEEQPPEEPAF